MWWFLLYVQILQDIPPSLQIKALYHSISPQSPPTSFLLPLFLSKLAARLPTALIPRHEEVSVVRQIKVPHPLPICCRAKSSRIEWSSVCARLYKQHILPETGERRQ